MHQVAEFRAAERIVAEVLDDGAAIGVGMRFFDLVFRQSRISLEQKRADLVGPEQVHDLLVRQNGVCGQTAATHEHNQQKRGRTAAKQAPTLISSRDCGPRCRELTHGLDPAEKQQNENDKEDQPYSSGRVIAPVSAVRPSGQLHQKVLKPKSRSIWFQAFLLLTFLCSDRNIHRPGAASPEATPGTFLYNEMLIATPDRGYLRLYR